MNLKNRKSKIVHFEECMIEIKKTRYGKPVLIIWKHADSTGVEVSGTKQVRKFARAILAEVGE